MGEHLSVLHEQIKNDLNALPGEVEIHFADKESRQINMIEQILIAKVFNFGGIYSHPKSSNFSDQPMR